MKKKIAIFVLLYTFMLLTMVHVTNVYVATYTAQNPITNNSVTVTVEDISELDNTDTVTTKPSTVSCALSEHNSYDVDLTGMGPVEKSIVEDYASHILHDDNKSDYYVLEYLNKNLYNASYSYIHLIFDDRYYKCIELDEVNNTYKVIYDSYLTDSLIKYWDYN